jgi:hypothetical protein
MYSYKKLIDDNKLLNDTVLELEAKISQLNAELLLNFKSVTEINYLQGIITKLELDNKNMREQSVNKEKEMKEKMNEIETKLCGEITRLNHELGVVNHKYTFINRLSSYVKSLEELNEDLVMKVLKMDEMHKKELQREYERNKIELDHLKKKSLDILTSAKRHAQISAHENLTSSTKLTVLQNIQLKNELANQSDILEQILNEMSKKEIIIKNLQIDLETHKEVENVLSSHNKKMVEIIKDYGMKNLQLEKDLQLTEQNLNSHIEKLNFLTDKNSPADRHSIIERMAMISTSSTQFKDNKKINFTYSDKMATTGHSFFNINVKTPTTTKLVYNLKSSSISKPNNKKLSMDTNIDTAASNTAFSLKSGSKIKSSSKLRSHITILDSYEKELKSGIL